MNKITNLAQSYLAYSNVKSVDKLPLIAFRGTNGIVTNPSPNLKKKTL